jgi:hypothetical protein
MITQKGRLLNICRGKHIFIALLKDWTLEDEEDGYSNFYSLGTGQDSVRELAVGGGRGGEVEEKEEGEEIK